MGNPHKQVRKKTASGSETEQSRSSLEHQAGAPPSGPDHVSSRDERSSGSASWDELEKAWNLDADIGDDEYNLEKLWTKHCNERKKSEKPDERRSPCPNLSFSFANQERSNHRRPNPMEEVLLGKHVSGAGMRNQEWLPRFLQKPQTKGTEAPILLGHESQHTSRGVNEWSTVTDALTNVLLDGMGDRGDEKDLATKRLLADTLYILRGFGMFQVELGAGQSGKALINTLRSASNNDKEIFRDAHVKCPINNRVCQASATLKFGTKRIGSEDDTTCLLSDFASVPTTMLEDWFLEDEKLERRLGAPTTIHGFAKAVTNQINYFGLIYGDRHREERIQALRFLIGIHEGAPELFTVEFIGIVWEQMNYDFFMKCQEGAKRLRQAVGKQANQTELRRIGCQLGPKGKARWFYPRTFEMTTEAGYWSRVVVPKMDEAIEKEGFATARDRILGKLPKRGGGEGVAPKGKAKAGTKGNAWKEWKEWKDAGKQVGGQPEVEEAKAEPPRMYPVGEKLTKTERNSAISNGPRNSANKAMCWDFNSHGGCRFGNKCFNAHETMLPSGLHWCVKAEMIRRGGFKQEKRVPPNDVDGMIRVLRETNLGIPGLQKDANSQQVGSNTSVHTPVLEKKGDVTVVEELARGKPGGKTVDNNPSAPSAPKDFLSFDFF